jgi:hypothetical protein
MLSHKMRKDGDSGRSTARTTLPEPSRTTRSYFTDGGRLYRLIVWIDRSKESMLAAVEDCRTLEILLVSAEQLRTWSEVTGGAVARQPIDRPSTP